MSECAVWNGVAYISGQVAWREAKPDIEGQTLEVRAVNTCFSLRSNNSECTYPNPAVLPPRRYWQP